MKRWRWWVTLGLLAVIAVLVMSTLWHPNPEVETAPRSDYEISGELLSNQWDYYPITQTLDPQWYRANGNWLGRLILPSVAETQQQSGDWVWLEVYHAPESQQGLLGQQVRLTWKPTPESERLLQLVTTDVDFSEAALNSVERGNILPTRLNGRKQVGPLQSLAGARPLDDVIVRFDSAELTQPGGNRQVLTVAEVPEMVTGRSVALVKILGEAPDAPPSTIPKACPGAQPCPSQHWQVQHYNLKTRQFDGLVETVVIPQQPQVNGERFMSTPDGLGESPVGEAGWYLYGAQGREGLFTVQALKPRSLVQLNAPEFVFRSAAGRRYIRQENWQDTPARKGTAQSVLVDPRSDSPDVALKQWQVGDRLLGMHLFGGIGGELGEKVVLKTVTGHFAFSLPKVIQDSFTQELQWEMPYYQVYAHNRQGILSGSQSWSNYAGDLRRGWVYTRPFSDVLVKLDSLQDYQFGDVRLSPLEELQRQLEIMMARYRTGDGTGYSGVNPAASCVQDSNQALFITIQELQRQVTENPSIQTWLTENPNDPEAQRFRQLQALGERLSAALEPRGIIRPDWQRNAKTLAGVTSGEDYSFVRTDTLASGLLSWQSMLPRSGEDTLSQLFLKAGAQLWFLRPNQIDGELPGIVPLAPTSIFGDVPVISMMGRKLLGSMVLLPTRQDWSLFWGVLGLYGAIAIPVGFWKGLLRWQLWTGNPAAALRTLAFLFLMPALVEEIIFRVFLLPYPSILNSPTITVGAMLLSLGLFVAYHTLNALFFYPPGRPLFFQPLFLSLAALLGIGAIIVYWFTGSLWLTAIFHWLIVAVWILCLGGEQKIHSQK